MKFEGGRAKPENLPVEETLEMRLQTLAEMKLELKEHKDQYYQKTKHLRESIKSLENIVTEEVIRRKQTVTVENIKAVYVPQVRFQMKKVNDEQ